MDCFCLTRESGKHLKHYEVQEKRDIGEWIEHRGELDSFISIGVL